MRAGLSKSITEFVQSQGLTASDGSLVKHRNPVPEKKQLLKQSLDSMKNHHMEWLDDSTFFNWRGDQPDMDSDDDVFEIFDKRRAVKLEPSSLGRMPPMSPTSLSPAELHQVPVHPAQPITQSPAPSSGRKPRTRTTSLGAGLAEGFNVKDMSKLSRTKSFQEISAALSTSTQLSESAPVESH
jgi:hypothetical protein